MARRKAHRLNPEFVSLQRHWYLKLKKMGFKDIEILQDDGEFFPLLSGGNFSNAQEEFYALAAAFLYEHSFQDPTDRSIWELFAEGKTYRTIAAALKLKLCRVFKVINQIKNGPFEEFKKQMNHG